ncbi:zinc ABC transporter substrate-binding protein [Luteolibacter sp. LG18]|uniref:metal ABC transporter solute-binding protein, Zn/Mn family n=1 Tax=Luteolibacter sp. LG18 TaxID=2819286 RepID=UPI0030C6DBBD
MTRTTGWLAALAVALGLTGCSPEKSRSEGKQLQVTTTVTMVTDLVSRVGGDRVKVKGLMGPGVDPHNYVPKLEDSTSLEKADVVFYGGLHLEGKMQETLEAMAKRGRVVVPVTSGIPEGSLLAPQEGFEGTKDPHVWGDSSLWVKTVDPVIETLSKADPEGAAGYRERGETYKKELEALNAWSKTRIAEIPADKRVLVTSHDAFFYFGKGFGFDVRGLQGVSTVAEAGIKDREQLVSFIRGRGIRTLFSESSVNAKGISAVAAEAGAQISKFQLFSDAMGKPGDTETMNGETYDQGTYIGMQKHNINAIVEGLK